MSFSTAATGVQKVFIRGTGAAISPYIYQGYRRELPSSSPGTITYFVTGGTAGSGMSYYTGQACGPVSSLAPYANNHVLYVTGGNVGILTNNPQHTLDVHGIVRAAAVMITSDMRKKENITRIGNALQKLLGVHGYIYDLIADGSHHYGVLAQEVEKVFPSLVLTDATGMKAVRYNSLVGVLIEAIHDIDARLHTTEQLLQDNEDMLTKLEDTLR